mmetsp:Transcript_75536/g.218184  ORF Transcript_75536/g.218184 Transcript_75536/m.218184 type:complete len:272 (+) Transcript_75536:48-863(+)|eukprot:CAMPEP_0170244634 /NCGR_PEP_ID=MMETSP0116_2-20130129/22097_1 /TAXON_ID=400756 /ORGANISM="Durinskia baltica, Strain CSIRO CS-38" /LENGTH=271 /DNA_ID=CAMNT_0010495497 /DNA_START=48 /DNA_END=863 /DNA_ORIENTATION=+
MAIVEITVAGSAVVEEGVESTTNRKGEQVFANCYASQSTAPGDSSTDDALSSEQETDDESDFVDAGDLESAAAKLDGSLRQLSLDSDAGDLESAAVKELRSVLETEASIAEKLEAVGKPGLVAALSSMMAHLASLGCKPHRATVFHSARPPPISIKDYMTRLTTYYHCSDGCLTLALVYIDRLLKIHPGFVVSALNIHRLLAVSIMVAAKFHDDVFYSNAYYAKVAGLQTKELNKLEEKFLDMLKWRMYVLPAEYGEYLSRVLLCVEAAAK